MRGVPLPVKVHVLLPASSVVGDGVPVASSPALPIRRLPATEIPPVPPVCVVTVSDVSIAELEKVKLLNTQLFEPESVPKFLAEAILCSTPPPVRLTVPVPVKLPVTVVFPVPEPERVPLTARLDDRLTAPSPVVKIALDPMVVTPVTLIIGSFVATVISSSTESAPPIVNVPGPRTWAEAPLESRFKL